MAARKSYNLEALYEALKRDNAISLIDYDKTKSLGGKIFAKPYLKFFYCKFDQCLTNLLNLVESNDSLDSYSSYKDITNPQGAGIAFVYSNLVKVGKAE